MRATYHIRQQLTCLNLMHGETHLANIFQNHGRSALPTLPSTHGRWFYTSGATRGTCQRHGYASFEEAKAAAIAVYEAQAVSA